MFGPPPVSDILISAPTEKELSVFGVNFINENLIKKNTGSGLSLPYFHLDGVKVIIFNQLINSIVA